MLWEKYGNLCPRCKKREIVENGYCKICLRERGKEYYQKHKEKWEKYYQKKKDGNKRRNKINKQIKR